MSWTDPCPYCGSGIHKSDCDCQQSRPKLKQGNCMACGTAVPEGYDYCGDCIGGTDDGREEENECVYCCRPNSEGHMISCPNNDTSFNALVTEGFD